MDKKLYEQNKKTIKEAVAKFRENAEGVFEKGMADLLDNAVQFALDSHDEGHQQHLKQGDSYGWALFRGKKMVRYKIFSQVANKKNAMYHAMKSVDVPGSKTWCGVIMAGMTPVGYFSTDYELNIFALTKEEIKTKFDSYFKPYMKSDA